MPLTPGDIEAKRFHDSWRGYNHEEVDAFLDEVAAAFVADREQVEAAQSRVRELEARIDTMRAGVEDARSTEMLLKRTLIAAQKAADQVMEESRAQSRQALASAQERATQIEAVATRRAWEIVQEAEGHSRELFDQIAWLRNFDQEQRVRLRDFFEGQLRMLASLAPVPEVGYAAEVRDGPAREAGHGDVRGDDAREREHGAYSPSAGQPGEPASAEQPGVRASAGQVRDDGSDEAPDPSGYGDPTGRPAVGDRAAPPPDRLEVAGEGEPQIPGAPEPSPSLHGDAGHQPAGGQWDMVEQPPEPRPADARGWWGEGESAPPAANPPPLEEEAFWAPAPAPRVSPGGSAELPVLAGGGVDPPGTADPRPGVRPDGPEDGWTMEPVDGDPAPIPFAGAQDPANQDPANQDPVAAGRAPRRRLAGRRKARTASSFRAGAGPDPEPDPEPDPAPPQPAKGPDDAPVLQDERSATPEESPSVRDLFWGRS